MGSDTLQNKLVSKEGLKAALVPIGQGTTDLAIAEARRAQKDYDREMADYEAEQGASDAQRAAAIRQSMEAYGFTEEEIEDAIYAAGYKAGGRVGLKGGGADFGGIPAAIQNIKEDEEETITIMTDNGPMEIQKSVYESMPGMFMDTTTSAYGDAGRGRPVPQFANGGRINFDNGGFEPFKYTSKIPKVFKEDVFGSDPLGSKEAYVYTYFKDAVDDINLEVANGEAVVAEALPTQNFSYEASWASTPFIKSQLISGARSDLFKFHTLGYGTNENSRFKISISNVKAAGEDGGTDYSVFTVIVRSFSDTDKRPVVLETFSNVNLDPASPNFIARRIGDRYLTIDSNGKITENGDWVNNSKYVRVEVAAQGSYPVSAAPFGHGAYSNPVKADTETIVPAVVYQTGSVVNTAGSPTYFAGFDFETTGVKYDNNNYIKPLPESVGVGSNVDFGFDSQLSYIMSGSDSSDMVKRQFSVAFQGGFDGQSPATEIKLGSNITAGNSQGLDLSSTTAGGYLSYAKAINAISNADEYDINMVATPGVVRTFHPAVITIDMVEARQDAFYIADFADVNYIRCNNSGKRSRF